MKDNKYILYRGEIELLFDEEKHLYTVNGKKADGTTGVLGVIAKPALMYWAVNQAIEHLQAILKPGQSYDELELKGMLDQANTAHRKRKEDAGDKGTIIHKWCEDWIAGKNPATPINPELKNATDKFLEWVNSNKVEFLESEKIIYSRDYNYAGTMDFLAKVNGKLIVGDFKTSSGIWDEYWFQVSAYQNAYEEEFPDTRIDGQIIVRIGKDATLEVKENFVREDYIENFTAFISALQLNRRILVLKDRAWKEKQKYVNAS